MSTHPLSRFVTLRAPLRAAPCWSWLLPLQGVRVSSFFARVCRDAHLPRPCRAEGGRTAPMTMPFGYVGIEHVSIRFTVHHARAPLGSWSTWSPRLVKTHFIFSSLASARRHVPTTLQPDAQPAVNQGQSACFDVRRALSCPCSSWFVGQHRISVAVTHPRS